MNPGSQFGAPPLGGQTPTYHLAPNFTTRPFPKGPWDLGTVVEDLKHFTPLNQGSDRVPIVEDEVYTHDATGIKTSLNQSAGSKLTFLAKLLDHTIRGEASLTGQRSGEDVYEIAKLRTRYFNPRRSYLQQVIKLRDVASYLDETNYGAPVYLITGIKIAGGTKISMRRGYEGEGGGNVGATIAGGVVDAKVQAAAEMNKVSGLSTENVEPMDCIVAIQVMKLYHKKKIFSKERVFKKEVVTRAAVLADDESIDEDEENYVVSGFDENELQNLWLEI